MGVAYSKEHLLRDINDYSDDELVALVDGIRERRLRVANQLAKAKNVTEQARREKLEEKLVKRYDKFVKMLEKADTAISNLEEIMAEVLAIRLQLGENPEDVGSDARLVSGSGTVEPHEPNV